MVEQITCEGCGADATGRLTVYLNCEANELNLCDECEAFLIKTLFGNPVPVGPVAHPATTEKTPDVSH